MCVILGSRWLCTGMAKSVSKLGIRLYTSWTTKKKPTCAQFMQWQQKVCVIFFRRLRLSKQIFKCQSVRAAKRHPAWNISEERSRRGMEILECPFLSFYLNKKNERLCYGHIKTIWSTCLPQICLFIFFQAYLRRKIYVRRLCCANLLNGGRMYLSLSVPFAFTFTDMSHTN